MLPTHLVVGLAVAVPVTFAYPEFGAAILVGALIGSVLPDLDMYSGHRRSLHFPTVYPLAMVPAVLLGALAPSMMTVTIAFLLVGATIHSRMDLLGGSLELRPWEATSDRGVYDHVQGQWRAPKRWIRYDGSPEDLALCLVVGVPLAIILTGAIQWVVIAGLVIGTVYTILRRRLAETAVLLVGFMPGGVQQRVPPRYRQKQA